MIILSIAGIALSIGGRQTFNVHTATGVHRSIFASPEPHWTGPSVEMRGDVWIMPHMGEIDFLTRAALSFMYIILTVPMIISFYFLARVLGNVAKGQIFTDQNAHYLLYYGLIQIAAAIAVPFVHLFIAFIANRFTASHIYLATGQDMLSGVIVNIAFLVAAYIIHYGVSQG